MSKHRKPQLPPRFPPARFRAQSPRTPPLLELDRFSTSDIEHWNARSQDVDELGAILYSGLEPQRKRYHDELIAALRTASPAPVEFTRWVRIVNARYNEAPLATAGSLRAIGGRFNIGAAVTNAIGPPWPALYVASNFETAYREKFGIAKDSRVDGLTAEELALSPGASFSAFGVNGHLSTVFDLAQPDSLKAVAKVLAKFTLPKEAVKLGRRLKLPQSDLAMIRTPKALMHALLELNWRTLPIQLGNPSSSQIFGSWVMEAGYEAIRYPSTKGDGDCLAVFPHRLASDDSYVELADAIAPSVRHTRLDMGSADQLCGWEVLPRSQHPPNEPRA